MAIAKWLLASMALVSPGLAITPEQLISAPRRSEAVPDPSGKVAVFSKSQYSFKSHKKSSEWNLLDLKSGKVSTLTKDPNVSEIVWLGKGKTVLYVNGTNSETPGGVEIWVSEIDDFEKGYKAGGFAGPLSGLKAVLTKKGDVNFVLNGKSTAEGKLYNPEAAKKPLSSARIYDSIWVRHWDYYLTPEFNAVFSGTLEKKDKKYNLSGKLHNLVAPVKGAESPYPPYAETSDYDISPDGKTVAFMSKAPERPKANLTTSYIYVVPQDGSSKAKTINGMKDGATPKGVKGASSFPKFSPDSKQLAYFQMKPDNYEADKRILYIATLGDKPEIRSVASKWDRSASSIQWTRDGKTLYISAEHLGTQRLFSVSAKGDDNARPHLFKTVGGVLAHNALGDSESVLVTASAQWSSILYYIASPKGRSKKLFYANEQDPELKGLSEKDIDEFYYRGQHSKQHAWIIKPKGFDKKKKYPLAFLIHGGPQSSWTDSWSSRWNPKTWADQGYVVVTPNPTGSTGFGQELTDLIQNNWGGDPYKDLVKAWEHVRDNLDYVDVKNGVAAGASYGGFMANWIQGMPLGRKFKAIVSHDGTFVASAKISTEELFFMEQSFNGTFWDARDNYEKYDPSSPEHIKAFATPQLVIHNDLDYRLPVAEGLSLFNILQERGVPSRFLNFPDENHWVISPENSLVWHQQCLGWINKYSGIEKSNPDAVKLSDTVVPVVNINP